MAKNWWKYGLCLVGGLVTGYLVGVKRTKAIAQQEKEETIESIREMYRVTNKTSKPAKPKEEEPVEKPDVTTKTSIQMEKLSEKKERADEALKKYSKPFDKIVELDENGKKKKRPSNDEYDPDDVDEIQGDSWDDYIEIVDELPEDSTYQSVILDYYADGKIAYNVTGQLMTDDEIDRYISEAALDKIDSEPITEVYVRNKLYKIDYTILYHYEAYADILDEEPYKGEL